MKILFAPAHYMIESAAGGSEFSWADNLIRSLAACPGVEVVAITGIVKPSAPFPPNVRIIALDRGASLHLTWAYRLGFVARTYLVARRVLRAEKIDVVHHLLPFGLNVTFNLLPLLGTVRGVPFVVGPLQAPHTYASNEEYIIYSQQKFTRYTGLGDKLQDRVGGKALHYGRGLLRWLSTTTLRRSRAATVVNDETAHLYATAIPGLRPRVIPPGIHVDAFRRGAPEGRSGCEIVTIGSLINRKGIDLIIRAMADLKQTHPHLRLRIIGEGPQRQRLEALACDLGVQDTVVFQGYVPNKEVAAYYHSADLYVSMSFSESFGQTVVEAMAAGLCVIAATNVGTRGIICDGQTGFLIRPGSVADLVRVLRMVWGDAALRTTVGAAAQRAAVERFDWPVIAAQYVDLYTSLRTPTQ